MRARLSRRRPGATGPSAAGEDRTSPFAGQAEAETHYQRMWRLRQMSASELRRLLGGDPAEAAPWIESAARYGLVEAQVRLGQMHLDGVGAPRDEAAALDWFTRAAKSGSPEAMNMVGRCYENGWGAAADLTAAAHWYALSAEAGHDWGEYNYANMLFDGRAVPCDREQAALWYQRAADQGHTRAMNLLARCYEEGWGVARDPARAFDWYRRSAEGGYFRAQYNFATLLVAVGRLDEALDWFEQACRAATPDSLRGMTEALMRRSEPPLNALGRRFGEALLAGASGEAAR
jgi:uncharacterized protein